MKTDVVLIAGPTASGKSALAIQLAKDLDGIIINADSMQIYDHLRLITARPSAEEESQAPHLLYGHVEPSSAYSVGQWLEDVKALLADDRYASKPMIFVGGTGLYFNGLLGGLAPIPEPDPAIRTALRQRLLDEGPQALWYELHGLDAQSAERLKPHDGQRLVRSLEVLQSTGKSLRYWQEQKGEVLVQPDEHRHIWLNPDRQILRDRIRRRFELMIAMGAVEEVTAFLQRGYAPECSAMKAIGVPEISLFLAGEMDLDEAIERAIIASAQYAKRQRTWFRGQFKAPWRQFSGHSCDIL